MLRWIRWQNGSKPINCLNIDKTNYCIFKTTCVNTDNIPDIVIDHRIIQRVDFCKYLGITLDCRLSFVHHINAIVSRVNQYCGIFYKLRNLLPVFGLRQLYFALVHPHLLYGLEILYGNTSASILDPLLKVNNKRLRILQNQSIRTPLSHLYSNFNILPITALCDLKIACLMHEYMYTILSLYPRFFAIISHSTGMFILITPGHVLLCTFVLHINQSVQEV